MGPQLRADLARGHGRYDGLDGYYSQEELAAILGKSHHALERWRRMRTGPPVTFIGKTPVYRIAAVNEWLLTQERQPVREPKRRRRAASNVEASA
jgi:hypothetical protein